MAKRKQVRAYKEVYFDNYTDLNGVKDNVDDLIAEYGEDATFSFSIQDYPYGGGPHVVFEVGYMRDETDDELNARVKREGDAKQKASDPEYQEFLRLKQKYK